MKQNPLKASIRRSTGVAFLLVAVSGVASANTVSGTCTPFTGLTELVAAPVTCTQFNPAMGTLTSITMTLSGSITSNITVTNNSTTQQTGTATTGVTFMLDAALPGFSFPAQPAALFTAAATTGLQVLPPSVKATFNNLISPTSTNGPLTNSTAATFATYEGTGMFTAPFDTLTSLTITGGGGQISATQTTTATVAATVTYTFTPPLVVTCAATGISGEIGVPFTSTAPSVSGGTPPYTFSLASGTLPAGLTLNTATGVITGTPTAIGTWSLQVKDSGGTTSTTTCPYSIGHLTPVCPTTGTTGTVGTPFSSPPITVTGGTPPYTFSVVGTIASGLTLNTSTGAITGTPTAPGSWSVQVSDSLGSIGSLTCPFVVSTIPLNLTCPTTGMFGTVGQPFNGPSLLGSITGGNPPYTFSIVGTLAPGLTLDTATGAITGTPTATGSWSVQVSDATGLVSNTCPYGVGIADLCPAPAYKVHYAANLNVGESYINIANPGTDGAPLLGPGLGPAAGNICVNVYAFDPNEELVSCCSCLVTPDQTVNLGVNRDLISKTLTGTVPTSVTVKLVSTLAGPGGVGNSCSNSAATVNTALPACGLTAWGTTLHATPSVGNYDTTESPFTAATLSPGEMASLAGRCSSIVGNGSGFGICSSCRAGALGGTKF